MQEMLSAANLAPVDLPRGPAGMQRCSLSATVLMQEEAREGAVDAAQASAQPPPPPPPCPPGPPQRPLVPTPPMHLCPPCTCASCKFTRF